VSKDIKPRYYQPSADIPPDRWYPIYRSSYFYNKYGWVKTEEGWVKKKEKRSTIPKRAKTKTITTPQPPSGAVDVSNLPPSKQREYAAERGYFLKKYGDRMYAVPPSSSHVKDVTDSYALQKAYAEAGWKLEVRNGRTYAIWEKGGDPQIPAVVDVTESMAGAKQLKEEGYEIKSVEGRTFAVHPRSGVTTEDLAEAVREARREAGKELAEQMARLVEEQRKRLDELQKRGLIQMARLVEEQRKRLDELQKRGLITYTEGEKIGEFNVTLQKPVWELTDEDIELLSQVGYDTWKLKTQRSLTKAERTLTESTLKHLRELERRGVIRLETNKETGEITATVTKDPYKLTSEEITLLRLAGFKIGPWQIKIPVGKGKYEVKTFESKEEFDRFIQNWRKEQMEKAGFKGIHRRRRCCCFSKTFRCSF